ncbi:Protein SMALL AUXIN UP-REGULATED RNA 54 [Linum grandiflorum]
MEGGQFHHLVKPKDLLRLLLCMVPHQHSGIATRTTSNVVGDDNESLLVHGSRLSNDGTTLSMPIPKGFIAVYVGPRQQRFVIPTTCLSMPEFVVLMDKVAEEVGFESEGGLHFPCEVEDFEEMLVRCLRMHKMIVKKKRHNRRSSSKVWDY